MPQPVYELSDMQDRPIKVQSYNYELVSFTVSSRTEFPIDKIVRTHNTNGIKQHLVNRKEHDETSNPWVNANVITKI